MAKLVRLWGRYASWCCDAAPGIVVPKGELEPDLGLAEAIEAVRVELREARWAGKGSWRPPLTRGFIEQHRRGNSGVEGLNAFGERNAQQRIRRPLNLFRQACAFIADQQRHRLFPVHLPRQKDGGSAAGIIRRSRRDDFQTGQAKLRKQNLNAYAMKNRQTQRRTPRGAQRLG